MQKQCTEQEWHSPAQSLEPVASHSSLSSPHLGTVTLTGWSIRQPCKTFPTEVRVYAMARSTHYLAVLISSNAIKVMSPAADR